MARTVIGLFDDFAQAQQVVRELVDTGFRREDISIVRNDEKGEFKQTDATGDVAGGAAKGAGTGAVLGGIAGLLVGLGALAIPGIGPIIAAGPIAATLAGAGIGAVAGGLVGALVDLGVPENEANYYAEGIRRGGTLVTVASPDNLVQTAVDIMNRNGAVDIDRRATEWQGQGTTGQTMTGGQQTTTRPQTQTTGMPVNRETAGTVTNRETASTQNINQQGEVRIPVVEEQVQVGKQQMQTGGVRIYTTVQETPVQENVTVRQEHVNVERRPVDRPVAQGDLDAMREGTLEVTETAEQAIVNKTARVVEEVVVNKNVTEQTVPVQDTVRRTDVRVEEVPGQTRTTSETRTTASGGTTMGDTTMGEERTRQSTTDQTRNRDTNRNA